MTEKKAKAWYCVFLEEQTGFFSLLLWFGSVLCFIGYAIQEDKDDKANLYLGIVLAFVVFVTGCFSYCQTSKAASLMDDFKNFIPRNALVIRDGKPEFEEMDASKLVVGDLVRIKTGDNIPADVILLRANEMKVNNASLTGESEDLERDLANKTANIFETGNVCFFGTMCTAGSGEGIVFKTGDNTVIGRIAALSQSAEAAETPLSIEITRFIKIISAVAITLGVTFFIFGLAIGYDIITNLVFAIGIIVANVPEGLLATVTVSLALTAKSMHRKKVLVKNLESVETLGSTSCICSDKTGTLTQNRMSVSQMFYDGKVKDTSINYEIFSNALNREKEKGENANLKNVQHPDYDITDPGFRNMINTVALSTTSFFSYTPPPEEVRAKLAKKKGKNIKDVPKDLSDMKDHPLHAAYLEVDKEMREDEEKRTWIKKSVQGDASETGLVKFCQPALMAIGKECLGKKENEWGLVEVRDAYPVVKDPQG